MKKHVIDANKVVINKATSEQQVKEATFEFNDVFAVDIVMSSGEGKPKQLENRTTVFKRDLEQKYSLKMKTSRAFFSEVNTRFPTLPFTLRAGKDERAWRMGDPHPDPNPNPDPNPDSAPAPDPDLNPDLNPDSDPDPNPDLNPDPDPER